MIPSGTTTSATRGKGQVAFTVKWPTRSQSRLVPTAAKSIKFTVTEYQAPNNIVVLSKTVVRPPDDQATSTVLLEGLPTVLVNIQAAAYPKDDATGVVQASGAVLVEIQQNATIEKSVTLDSVIKTVEVTAAAPITISPEGKFSLNLSDQTNIKAALTATAYNAAHDVVLTALDKWVYKSEKPSVATVSTPTRSRAEGIDSATATVTAVSNGTSVLTITESESQVSRQLTVGVVGSLNLGWNQQLGDAQNSSCSSGSSAAGGIAGTFGPVPDGDPSQAANQFDTSFNGLGEFIESPSGNVAFTGTALFISDSGLFEYSRSGSRLSKRSVASPAYGPDGTLYSIQYGFFGPSGFIRATGASNWTFSSDFSSTGSSELTLSGDGGTLYAVLKGTLYAFDAKTGAKRWQLATGISHSSAPKPAVSLDNATVYEITGSGLAAFDAATGNKLWESNNGGFADSNYVGVGPNGMVYTEGAGGAGISALDPATGQVVWSNPNVYGPFVLSRNGSVNGVTASGTNQYRIIALNGTDGTVRWTSGSGYGVSISSNSLAPLFMGAADGTLYVTKSENRDFYNVSRLTALSGESGTEKWTLTPNLLSTITGSGGTAISGSYRLLCVAGDGTVYAFGTPASSTSPALVTAIK